MEVIHLYTNGFLLIFKIYLVIFAAHLVTSCGAPFENHCSKGRTLIESV
jgi:hypothetical protein